MSDDDSPVLVITGASSGIGAATARAAANEGYRLVLAARSGGKLEKLQQELSGGEPGGFSGADPEVWKDMILINILDVGITLQVCMPELRKSRGHVLITGSAAGRATLPGFMHSATKWAVSAIGFGVREELRGRTISPAPLATR